VHVAARGAKRNRAATPINRFGSCFCLMLSEISYPRALRLNAALPVRMMR
jgi:hypothetical protein